MQTAISNILHRQRQQQNAITNGTTLSMIHESASYDDTHLNRSITSEVTMLPRTPNHIMTAGATPATDRSKNSVNTSSNITAATATVISLPSHVDGFASSLITSTQHRLQSLWDTLGAWSVDQ